MPGKAALRNSMTCLEKCCSAPSYWWGHSWACLNRMHVKAQDSLWSLLCVWRQPHETPPLLPGQNIFLLYDEKQHYCSESVVFSHNSISHLVTKTNIVPKKPIFVPKFLLAPTELRFLWVITFLVNCLYNSSYPSSHILKSDDGGRMFLRNVRICLQ
jgi:hypothetical protein